jgi:protein involved in polysaccharide export with SLBB domain
MTRSELEELLDRYESVVESPGYSEALKDDARRAAALIRERLEEGDFKVGDRIVLRLEGIRADPAPDTLRVEEGPALDIPNLGVIPLEGVLRSELEEHLTEELSRFIRDPTVTAHSLIRLSVQGAVGVPGFYVFPSEMLLSDVLMQAGGPASSADLEDVRIRRGEELLMDGSEVQMALDEGRSLDQLGLQAGDEITIPQEPQQTWWPQVIRWGVALTTTLLLGVRIF